MNMRVVLFAAACAVAVTLLAQAAPAGVAHAQDGGAGKPALVLQRVSSGRLYLGEGKSYRIGAKTDSDARVTYKSSDPKAVKVSKAGVLKARGRKGRKLHPKATVTATATSPAGTRAVKKIRVTVKPRSQVLKVTRVVANAWKAPKGAKVGETVRLKPGMFSYKTKHGWARSQDSSKVTWRSHGKRRVGWVNKNIVVKSSDKRVLAAAAPAKAKAVGPGRAVLTVRCAAGGKAARVSVKVKARAAGKSATRKSRPAAEAQHAYSVEVVNLRLPAGAVYSGRPALILVRTDCPDGAFRLVKTQGGACACEHERGFRDVRYAGTGEGACDANLFAREVDGGYLCAVTPLTPGRHAFKLQERARDGAYVDAGATVEFDAVDTGRATREWARGVLAEVPDPGAPDADRLSMVERFIRGTFAYTLRVEGDPSGAGLPLARVAAATPWAGVPGAAAGGIADCVTAANLMKAAADELGVESEVAQAEGVPGHYWLQAQVDGRTLVYDASPSTSTIPALDATQDGFYLL